MSTTHRRLRTAFHALSCLGALLAANMAHAQRFPAGTFDLSVGGRYTLGTVSVTMTAAGDLQVEEASGKVLWRSGTRALCANSPCRAHFQNDHNFVITNSAGVPMSLSDTADRPEVELTFSATPPYLSVGASGAAPVWRSGADAFKPGELTLSAGQRVAFDGVNLGIGATGELQVRRVYPDALLWSTGALPACSSSPCTLRFASDGALTVSGSSGLAWTTGLARNSAGDPVPLAGDPASLPVRLVLSRYSPHVSVQQIVTTASKKLFYPVLWGTGPDANAMTYSGGSFKMLMGEQRRMGGITLALTGTGQIQLLDAAGTTAPWPAPPACRDLSRCDLKLQGDGNFGFSDASWNSHTNGRNGSTLTLSNKPPYLVLVSPRFDRLWSPDKLDSLPVRLASPPVRGYVNGQASSTVSATTVQSFLDSMGVNSHHDQGGTYANVGVVRQMLMQIGVRNVREHTPDPRYPDRLAWFAALAQSPPYARFNLVNNRDVDVFLEQARMVADLRPGAVDSVEGLNEINNFGFTFDGVTCGPGAPNACGGLAVAMQASLFNVMKTSSLASVPVYDLTDGLSAMHATRHGLQDFTGRANFGTVHPYPRSGYTQPQATLEAAMNASYDNKLATQGVVTETGYQSPNVVSEMAQAIMGLNLWFDGYRLGYRRTFIYELLDSGTEKFGMHDASGNPKKLALATRNLTTILRDTGAPLTTTESLPWSVSPAFAGNALLLQKSDKSLYLILWSEQAVADAPTASGPVDKSPPATRYTFTVPANKKVNVYDPVVSASPKSPNTFNAVNNTVTVDLGGNPLIVEIKAP